MCAQIYTIQLNETALKSFLTTATHTNHNYQMGNVDQETYKAIRGFGEHLMDKIVEHPDVSTEEMFRMAFGYNSVCPTVDLDSDIVDEYFEALEALNTADATIRCNPYQDALDTFYRNEETLDR